MRLYFVYPYPYLLKAYIPVLGSCASGNASDKKLNNEVLSRLSEYMAAHGLAQGAFVYVADSALVNENNLELLFDILFIRNVHNRSDLY